jgi:hypothetical protein
MYSRWRQCGRVGRSSIRQTSELGLISGKDPFATRPCAKVKWLKRALIRGLGLDRLLNRALSNSTASDTFFDWRDLLPLVASAPVTHIDPTVALHYD